MMAIWRGSGADSGLPLVTRSPGEPGTQPHPCRRLASESNAWFGGDLGPPRRTQLVRQDRFAAIEDTTGKLVAILEMDWHRSISSAQPAWDSYTGVQPSRSRASGGKRSTMSPDAVLYAVQSLISSNPESTSRRVMAKLSALHTMAAYRRATRSIQPQRRDDQLWCHIRGHGHESDHRWHRQVQWGMGLLRPEWNTP